jgi:hypothetical protein
MPLEERKVKIDSRRGGSPSFLTKVMPLEG